jgi:hypothetical protein
MDRGQPIPTENTPNTCAGGSGKRLTGDRLDRCAQLAVSRPKLRGYVYRPAPLRMGAARPFDGGNELGLELNSGFGCVRQHQFGALKPPWQNVLIAKCRAARRLFLTGRRGRLFPRRRWRRLLRRRLCLVCRRLRLLLKLPRHRWCLLIRR